MSDPVIDASDPGHAPVEIAPFSFWPTTVSKIAGLGGNDTSPDPNYVFHSFYTEVQPGEVRATMRFAELRGETGVITLRINAHPVESASQVVVVKTWVVPIRDIIAAGGRFAATFEALSDMRYAVLGHIYTETDAAANNLSIEVLTIRGPQDYRAKRDANRRSLFGRKVFRRANRMFASTAPSLRDPVSQTCTAAQFSEPAYAKMAAILGQPVRKDRAEWEMVFALQVFTRYAILNPGAKGLDLARDCAPLAAAIAATGTEIARHDILAHSPAAASSELADFQSSVNRIVPDDLEDFDFLWSSGVAGRLGSINAGLDFVRESIGCLKVGGHAVHLFDLNLSSNDETLNDQATVLFRRRDVERLAVDLASRGHLIAQIKYDMVNALVGKAVPADTLDSRNRAILARYDATSIGVIVRRGER